MNDLPRPALLQLHPGQVVRVLASDGTPIVEIGEGATGPEVRLLGPDATLATEGCLRLQGQRVEVVATDDDVVVQGRFIHLN